MSENSHHKYLQDENMQSVPSFDIQIREQPLSRHIDNKTPFIKKLIQRLRIPPIQIKHPIFNLR